MNKKKIQPLSFDWGNRIVVKEIDKKTYNPRFETYYHMPAERELFEFKSVSAASYFLKLFKDDLEILYSGLVDLMRYTTFYRRIDYDQKKGEFHSQRKTK